MSAVTPTTYRPCSARDSAMARAGHIELHISGDILGEVLRVLRDMFHWTDEALALAKDRIGDFTKTIQPGQAVQIVTADPPDNRIIECALAGKSDYIVTGDKHLLDLGQVGDVKIVKPADFITIQSRTEHRR